MHLAQFHSVPYRCEFFTRDEALEVLLEENQERQESILDVIEVR